MSEGTLSQDPRQRKMSGGAKHSEGVRGAASDSDGSISNRLRNARFRKFAALADSLPKPIRILDIGGTNNFWAARGWGGRNDIQITLLNLEPQERQFENIDSRVGDATNLHDHADRSWDIAFSNSVIEHLSTIENQRKMAAECLRISKAHWMQTPNFWFPMEPHFHILGWQWLPREARIRILQKRRCGWRGPCPDRAQAESLVDEVRLLTHRELRSLFPHSTIWRERFGGLVKSWVAYGGFPERASETSA